MSETNLSSHHVFYSDDDVVLSTGASKTFHLITALLTVLVGAAAFWLFPELAKDQATALSSAGTFLGLYGVLFAVVELLRLRSATVIAAQAAQDARQAVKSAYSLRDAAECQSCIEYALAGLDGGDSVPSAALNRISRLYSAEFSEDMNVETSQRRRNVALLQSYVIVARAGSKSTTNSLKATLMQMASDLAQRGQKAISERRQS